MKTRLFFQLVFLLVIFMLLSPRFGSFVLAASPNLAPNPSFENGTTQPDNWRYGSNEATYTWSSSVHHSGSRSICISQVAPHTNHRVMLTSAQFPFGDNKAYRMSVWVRGNVPDSTEHDVSISVLPYYPDGSSTRFGAGLRLGDITNNDWTYRETVLNLIWPSGAASAELYLEVNTLGQGVPGEICFDDVVFKEVYQVTGTVRDVNGQPIPNVLISDGAGNSTYTFQALGTGQYLLWEEIGTYTLTPSKSGYGFSPSSRTVSVPPGRSGQDFTGTPILNVPLFKQGTEPFTDNDPWWEGHIYDDADRQSPDCGMTMADCGCATSSVAMMLAYYGVTHAPLAAPVALETNPATVNAYFKLDPRSAWCGVISRGYLCGGVNWYAAAQYSRDAYMSYGTQMIAFNNGTSDYDPDLVRQEINANNPVILRVPGPQHWVVATGVAGDTFTINDPLHNRTRLDDLAYGNDGLTMRRYIRTASDFSAIVVGVVAPAQLLITDEDGNRTGFDPATSTVVMEIPNSTYFFDPALANGTGQKPPPPDDKGNHWVIVTTPQAGTYNIEAIAPPNQSYTFAFYAYNRDANLSLNMFEGQPGSDGVQDRYTFTYNPDVGTTTISLQVPIDIQPGGSPNAINCKAKNGVIPVAILTTDAFDARTVDHTTVIFEGARETHVDKKTGQPIRHEEDVDGDGNLDLVFHFRSGDTALTCGSTHGTLIGSTFDSLPIQGTDSVRMVPSTARSLEADLSTTTVFLPIVAQ